MAGQNHSETETIQLSQSTIPEAEALSQHQGTEGATEDNEFLLLMLYIKDRFGVSHTAYHEMAKVCKQLPRQCQLQKKIKE